MTHRDSDTVQLWRSLLAVAQAAHTVLEREIPEAHFVPARGMPILRLLRWHGPKTLDAIARFLDVSATEAGAIVAAMAGAEFVTKAWRAVQ